MNTIGIDNNLNRARIKKLLTIGLIASIITGVGDFLLGYGEETIATNFATSLMSNAQNLADWQLIAGGLLGLFGLFLEGLAFFAVYRLMADAAPKYAHIYRAGIFGYICLAPIGCHMNVGVFNMAYKYLLQGDGHIAEQVSERLIYGFTIPIYILLVIFWVPMIVIQFMAFAKGLTPYPKRAKWFNLIVGMIPAFILSGLFGFHTAHGAGIGTMFLSFGNAFMFGGLLAMLPNQECIDAFEKRFTDKETI